MIRDRPFRKQIVIPTKYRQNQPMFNRSGAPWPLIATLLIAGIFALGLAAQRRPEAPRQKPTSSGLGGIGPAVRGTPDDPLRDPREIHLRHVKQLTFGGQNAEAYFSYDGNRLVFQSTRDLKR